MILAVVKLTNYPRVTLVLFRILAAIWCTNVYSLMMLMLLMKMTIVTACSLLLLHPRMLVLKSRESSGAGIFSVLAFFAARSFKDLIFSCTEGRMLFAAQNAGTSILQVMISKRIVDSKPGNSLITLPPPALGHSQSSPPELPWHEQNFKKC